MKRDRLEPTLSYERYDVPEMLGVRETALATLQCHGPYSLIWTLEPGSARELLFLAFMAEFMPPTPEQDLDDGIPREY